MRSVPSVRNGSAQQRVTETEMRPAIFHIRFQSVSIGVHPWFTFSIAIGPQKQSFHIFLVIPFPHCSTLPA